MCDHIQTDGPAISTYFKAFVYLLKAPQWGQKVNRLKTTGMDAGAGIHSLMLQFTKYIPQDSTTEVTQEIAVRAPELYEQWFERLVSIVYGTMVARKNSLARG